jgi:CheY-like chemotaxis protein
LLVWRSDAHRILKTRILIFENGRCLSKCPFCKSEVVVPIKLLDGHATNLSAETTEAETCIQDSRASADTGSVETIEQLIRDLEKTLVPLTVYVRSLVSNGTNGATRAQIDQVRECVTRIRQVGELVERTVNKVRWTTSRDGAGSAQSRNRTARREQRNVSGLGGTSVLVVDDDHGVREFFRLSLGMAGADVMLAESAERGIDLVSSQQFDAAFIEILLPEMTGLRVLEEIRKHDRDSDRETVVYMMSRDPNEIYAAVSAQLGAVGVINKTVSLKDVAMLLQKTLRLPLVDAAVQT